MGPATGTRSKPRQTEPDHFPIIVVGAGPTGLTLANLLGVYGARTLVVERNAGTVAEPRAVSIDDESLRTMQAAGLIDTVLPSVVPGYGSEYRTPSGRCFLKVSPTGRPYGYPRRNAFRQPVLEAQLRGGLDRFNQVETRFNCELLDFEQDESHVTVTLRSAKGEVMRVTCDYLVGADGAGSAVRTKLGLILDGETFSEKWLIIDLERSPTSSRETQVFCDVRRPCIALPGPDQTRRYEFKLLPGETPEQVMDSAMVARLLEDHGAAPESVIKRKTVYTFHARLAPRWSQDRVFLAGDACHLTPPFAGQGMNSGIRDAHNLAWKLAWTVSGRASARLLETYERERRDHVGAMIQLALRMGRIMGPKTRLLGLLTQTAFSALSVWPAARDYFAEMKYKPKPRFDSGFIVDSDQPDRATLVGRLLPQPTVADRHGRNGLLDTWLGDGFALVGIGVDAEQLAEIARLPTLQRLSPRIVRVATKAREGAPPDMLDLLVKPGDFDGAQTGRILLIRPDRYVAGAFLPSQAQAFSVQLGLLLGTPAQVTPHRMAASPA